MNLKDIHVPQGWAALGERAVEVGGPVLVLGAVDSGKSTLVRYLLGRMVGKFGAAALLDGDLGMATVGTPGLVGLTLVRDVDQLLQRIAPDRTWFVGSSTPAGAFLPTVLGHSRLIAVARAERLPVVVNTCGLVQGSAGKALQLSIVDAVEARLVAGIARGGEIDHLLEPLVRRGTEVFRLEPSPRARAKPRAERTQLRAERFARYFESAAPVELDLAQFAVEGALLGSGRPLEEADREAIERVLYAHVVAGEAAGEGFAVVLDSAPEEPAPEILLRELKGRGVHVLEAWQTTGLLTGFLGADGDCLGLGLLEEWKGGNQVRFRTPLSAAELGQARRLSFGRLRLSWTGEELGFAPREREIAPPEPVG